MILQRNYSINKSAWYKLVPCWVKARWCVTNSLFFHSNECKAPLRCIFQLVYLNSPPLLQSPGKSILREPVTRPTPSTRNWWRCTWSGLEDTLRAHGSGVQRLSRSHHRGWVRAHLIQRRFQAASLSSLASPVCIQAGKPNHCTHCVLIELLRSHFDWS